MNDSANLPLAVYTPESQVRNPIRLLRSMWSNLLASKELAWRLFVRDLSARYRQSMFGIVWAFIPPIVTSLIFILLQSSSVVDFGETEIPYPVYVLVGTILWQLFADSVNAPLRSVNNSRAMLAKINFPREALVVSATLLVLFDLLIKALILAVIFIIFGLQPTWALLIVPVSVLLLVILGISIGLLITPVGALYTDVSTSLPLILQFLFFVTPVVYTPPQFFPFSLLAVINPVSPLLIATRDLITLGTITNLTPFLVVAVFSLVLLAFSWTFYHLTLPIIIERMSA